MTAHPEAERSALFVYDDYRGGVGLARNGYDHIEKLRQYTWELLADYGVRTVVRPVSSRPTVAVRTNRSTNAWL